MTSSTWDGSDKAWTLDCESCPYRTEQTCRWGIAIKRLRQVAKVIHCQTRKQPPRGLGAYAQGYYLKTDNTTTTEEPRQAAMF